MRCWRQKMGQKWGLILHVFLMGYVFVDELRVLIRRQVNTQKIDAVSTSHLHLIMNGFTLAQKQLASS